MTAPTIVFYPNTQKVSKKSNLIPIYLRIRNGKSKTEVKLEAYLDPNDLHYWDDLTMRLNKPNNRVNQVIESICHEFMGLPYTQRENYHKLSPEEIKNKILPHSNVTSGETSFIKYIQDYYNNTVIPSSKFTRGTKANYNKSITHLIKFLTLKELMHLSLNQFTNEYASQFNDYLMSDFPTVGKKGMSKVSATSVFIK
jgi:hypothetical protein